jgi:hypothetical protein
MTRNKSIAVLGATERWEASSSRWPSRWGTSFASWSEVMCATEDGLSPETLCGPTKPMETVGPVDECPLEQHALDRDMAAKLCTLSEQKTSLSWSP